MCTTMYVVDQMMTLSMLSSTQVMHDQTHIVHMCLELFSIVLILLKRAELTEIYAGILQRVGAFFYTFTIMILIGIL